MYYRPPGSSRYFAANFDETFNDTHLELKRNHNRIGDFNINFVKASEHKKFQTLWFQPDF